MLNELVADVLQRTVGLYCEGVNSKTVKVQALKGKVTLHNVGVKSDVFLRNGVPFELLDAKISKIDVDVPWQSLLSTGEAKVVIQVDGLQGTLKASGLDPKGLLSKAKEEKLRSNRASWLREDTNDRLWLLKGLDLFSAPGLPCDKASEDSAPPGKIAQKIQDAIRNLEVCISNIDLRLEDDVSEAPSPIQAHIHLSKFRLFSTDKNFHKAYSSAFSSDSKGRATSKDPENVYKLIELDGLSLNWKACGMQRSTENGWLQVISPVSASVRLTIVHEENLTEEDQQGVIVSATLSKVHVHAHAAVLRSAAAVGDGAAMRLAASRAASLRPLSSVQGNAKAWWQYAITAATHFNPSTRISIDKAVHFVRHSKDYVPLYAQLLAHQGDLSSFNASEIETMRVDEESLPLAMLYVFREKALVQAKSIIQAMPLSQQPGISAETSQHKVTGKLPRDKLQQNRPSKFLSWLRRGWGGSENENHNQLSDFDDVDSSESGTRYRSILSRKNIAQIEELSLALEPSSIEPYPAPEQLVPQPSAGPNAVSVPALLSPSRRKGNILASQCMGRDSTVVINIQVDGIVADLSHSQEDRFMSMGLSRTKIHALARTEGFLLSMALGDVKCSSRGRVLLQKQPSCMHAITKQDLLRVVNALNTSESRSIPSDTNKAQQHIRKFMKRMSVIDEVLALSNSDNESILAMARNLSDDVLRAQRSGKSALSDVAAAWSAKLGGGELLPDKSDGSTTAKSTAGKRTPLKAQGFASTKHLAFVDSHIQSRRQANTDINRIILALQDSVENASSSSIGQGSHQSEQAKNPQAHSGGDSDSDFDDSDSEGGEDGPHKLFLSRTATESESQPITSKSKYSPLLYFAVDFKPDRLDSQVQIVCRVRGITVRVRPDDVIPAQAFMEESLSVCVQSMTPAGSISSGILAPRRSSSADLAGPASPIVGKNTNSTGMSRKVSQERHALPDGIDDNGNTVFKRASGIDESRHSHSQKELQRRTRDVDLILGMESPVIILENAQQFAVVTLGSLQIAPELEELSSLDGNGLHLTMMQSFLEQAMYKPISSLRLCPTHFDRHSILLQGASVKIGCFSSNPPLSGPPSMIVENSNVQAYHSTMMVERMHSIVDPFDLAASVYTRLDHAVVKGYGSSVPVAAVDLSCQAINAHLGMQSSDLLLRLSNSFFQCIAPPPMETMNADSQSDSFRRDNIHHPDGAAKEGEEQCTMEYLRDHSPPAVSVPPPQLPTRPPANQQNVFSTTKNQTSMNPPQSQQDFVVRTDHDDDELNSSTVVLMVQVKHASFTLSCDYNHDEAGEQSVPVSNAAAQGTKTEKSRTDTMMLNVHNLNLFTASDHRGSEMNAFVHSIHARENVLVIHDGTISPGLSALSDDSEFEQMHLSEDVLCIEPLAKSKSGVMDPDDAWNPKYQAIGLSVCIDNTNFKRPKKVFELHAGKSEVSGSVKAANRWIHLKDSFQEIIQNSNPNGSIGKPIIDQGATVASTPAVQSSVAPEWRVSVDLGELAVHLNEVILLDNSVNDFTMVTKAVHVSAESVIENQQAKEIIFGCTIPSILHRKNNGRQESLLRPRGWTECGKGRLVDGIEGFVRVQPSGKSQVRVDIGNGELLLWLPLWLNLAEYFVNLSSTGDTSNALSKAEKNKRIRKEVDAPSEFDLTLSEIKVVLPSHHYKQDEVGMNEEHDERAKEQAFVLCVSNVSFAMLSIQHVVHILFSASDIVAWNSATQGPVCLKCGIAVESTGRWLASGIEYFAINVTLDDVHFQLCPTDIIGLVPIVQGHLIPTIMNHPLMQVEEQYTDFNRAARTVTNTVVNIPKLCAEIVTSFQTDRRHLLCKLSGALHVDMRDYTYASDSFERYTVVGLSNVYLGFVNAGTSIPILFDSSAPTSAGERQRNIEFHMTDMMFLPGSPEQQFMKQAQTKFGHKLSSKLDNMKKLDWKLPVLRRWQFVDMHDLTINLEPLVVAQLHSTGQVIKAALQPLSRNTSSIPHEVQLLIDHPEMVRRRQEVRVPVKTLFHNALIVSETRVLVPMDRQLTMMIVPAVVLHHFGDDIDPEQRKDFNIKKDDVRIELNLEGTAIQMIAASSQDTARLALQRTGASILSPLHLDVMINFDYVSRSLGLVQVVSHEIASICISYTDLKFISLYVRKVQCALMQKNNFAAMSRQSVHEVYGLRDDADSGDQPSQSTSAANQDQAGIRGAPQAGLVVQIAGVELTLINDCPPINSPLAKVLVNNINVSGSLTYNAFIDKKSATDSDLITVGFGIKGSLLSQMHNVWEPLIEHMRIESKIFLNHNSNPEMHPDGKLSLSITATESVELVCPLQSINQGLQAIQAMNSDWARSHQNTERFWEVVFRNDCDDSSIRVQIGDTDAVRLASGARHCMSLTSFTTTSASSGYSNVSHGSKQQNHDTYGEPPATKLKSGNARQPLKFLFGATDGDAVEVEICNAVSTPVVANDRHFNISVSNKGAGSLISIKGAVTVISHITEESSVMLTDAAGQNFTAVLPRCLPGESCSQSFSVNPLHASVKAGISGLPMESVAGITDCHPGKLLLNGGLAAWACVERSERSMLVSICPVATITNTLPFAMDASVAGEKITIQPGTSEVTMARKAVVGAAIELQSEAAGFISQSPITLWSEQTSPGYRYHGQSQGRQVRQDTFRRSVSLSVDAISNSRCHSFINAAISNSPQTGMCIVLFAKCVFVNQSSVPLTASASKGVALTQSSPQASLANSGFTSAGFEDFDASLHTSIVKSPTSDFNVVYLKSHTTDISSNLAMGQGWEPCWSKSLPLKPGGFGGVVTVAKRGQQRIEIAVSVVAEKSEHGMLYTILAMPRAVVINTLPMTVQLWQGNFGGNTSAAHGDHMDGSGASISIPSGSRLALLEADNVRVGTSAHRMTGPIRISRALRTCAKISTFDTTRGVHTKSDEGAAIDEISVTVETKKHSLCATLHSSDGSADDTTLAVVNQLEDAITIEFRQSMQTSSGLGVPVNPGCEGTIHLMTDEFPKLRLRIKEEVLGELDPSNTLQPHAKISDGNLKTFKTRGGQEIYTWFVPHRGRRGLFVSTNLPDTPFIQKRQTKKMDSFAADGLTVTAKFCSIGFSLRGLSGEELVYLRLNDLSAKMSLADCIEADLVLGGLQIDNTESIGEVGIIAYNEPPPEETGMADASPALRAALVMHAAAHEGFHIVHRAEVFLQPIVVLLPEELLMRIAHAVLSPDNTALGSQTLLENGACRKRLRDKVLAPAQVFIPAQQAEGTHQVFSPSVLLHPLRFTISFLPGREPTDAPMEQIFGAVTSLLAGISELRIEVDSLHLQGLQGPTQQAMSHIAAHFQEQILWQVAISAIGSLEVIGSPAGLIRGMANGVQAMFYEPYNAWRGGDGNDVGDAVGRGAASLLHGVVGSTFKSVSGISGSVARGLHSLAGNGGARPRPSGTPKDVEDGLQQGVQQLGKGFMSGLKGLVDKPKEGLKSSGVAGLVQGVGEGVVGAVINPVSGVFDFVSTASSGVHAGTANLTSHSSRRRSRVPIAPSSGSSAEAYCFAKALAFCALNCVKSGKYSEERKGVRFWCSYQRSHQLRGAEREFEDRFCTFLITKKRVLHVEFASMEDALLGKTIVKFSSKLTHTCRGHANLSCTIKPGSSIHIQKQKRSGFLLSNRDKRALDLHFSDIFAPYQGQTGTFVEQDSTSQGNIKLAKDPVLIKFEAMQEAVQHLISSESQVQESTKSGSLHLAQASVAEFNFLPSSFDYVVLR